MKLSEAIRLGAMMGPQVYHGGTEGLGRCAMKAAALAVGVEAPTTHEAESLFPWSRAVITACPLGDYVRARAATIAEHLNDFHHWTRERIADWVATIEPAEVELSASETNGECSQGTGPKRLQPEVVRA